MFKNFKFGESFCSYKKDTFNGNLIKLYNNCQYKNNFNYSYNPRFPNLDSEILLYLSMWQYWWWFWFCFLTVFYYLLIFSIFSKRQKYFNPRINTSLKSHGKWGDLIVGLIPIYWCINILINSNTLLKMLEWQTESNILTLRIRGKQWYWIYKIDLFYITFKDSLEKNVGHNYIVRNNFKKNENRVFLKYLQNVYNIRYYKRHCEFYFQKKYFKSLNYLITSKNLRSKLYLKNENHLNFVKKNKNLKKSLIQFKYVNCFSIKNNLFTVSLKKKKSFIITKKFNVFDFLNVNFTKNNDAIFKFYKSWEITSLFKNQLRRGKAHFSFVKDSVFVKFYKPTYKKYPFDTVFMFKNERLQFLNKHKAQTKNYFTNFEKFIYSYRKYNKTFYDLSSRLLKTKEMLVLPSNINMAVITNSFDVVHSWFVPGLGIKMDCVPGRSTHHSFCFDINGLFYGQCAEICGRFHHHMPIKVAIIYYESFFLWFNHIALKKLWKK